MLLGPARDLMDRRQPAQDLLAALPDRGVEAAGEELRKTVRERADVGRDRHLVVVEDHEQVGAGAPGVVQGLERHAAGEPAVADDRDHLAGARGAPGRDRHARRRADGGARVADPEGVVGALVALRERRDAFPLAHRVHPVAPARQDLVGIALVSHVPDDPVVRGVVQVVEGDGELDRPEPGREMAAGPRDAVDEVPAELPGHVAQSALRQPPEILRGVDRREQGVVRVGAHAVVLSRPERPLRAAIIGTGRDAGQARR